ncbi:MAG: diaminopimelate epimerase [Eubacteriales bacterium]
MREIAFTKMHGIGNDYIYFNFMNDAAPAEGLTPDDTPALAVEMSRRHFSVGADGIVCICPPDGDGADAKMRMFNADGSEGKMCGNAIRCVGKFLYDRGIAKKEKLVIETLSGRKYLTLAIDGGICTGASVDMGFAVTEPSAIPLIYDGGASPMIGHECIIGGYLCKATAVSMGNPHCVIFTNDTPALPADPYELDLEKIGPSFENDEKFPERVNTEFVRAASAKELWMRVWERGSGETYACGTGACASAAAAVLCGYCPAGQPITVHLRGGDLTITVAPDRRVTMQGSASLVYDGVFYC